MGPLRPGIPALAILIAAGCARPPSAADEGARLMAQMKAASGGGALDAPAGFHEVGTVVRDGVVGTYEVWGDLHALRSTATHTLDGRTSTNGFDGQIAWAVGPDGAVHNDPSPQGLASARLGTYLTISGFFYPDRFPARFESRGQRVAGGASYDVVTVTPANSIPADLWLDLSTHRLQRVTGTDGTTSFEVVVGRYELREGIQVAVALSQTEGEHRMKLEITSMTYGPVTTKQFAAPAQ